jgi:Transcriptional regulatory protein, C terminal
VRGHNGTAQRESETRATALPAARFIDSIQAFEQMRQRFGGYAWKRVLDKGHCDRSLDVLVCRLRRIIEPDPSTPRLIQTIRGRGYVFTPAGLNTAPVDCDELGVVPLGPAWKRTFSINSYA